MGLDAGSATGQLELDLEGWKQGFDDAANAAKRAETVVNSSMVSAGKEIEKAGDAIGETASKTGDLGKASVSLEGKLGSLIATAGSMATLKAGVSAIMGSMDDWAAAELATDRLREALKFKGMESSLSLFTDLGSRLQTLTGISNNTIEQMAAEAIAQGKSVQQAYDLINASVAFSSVTGKDAGETYKQLSKTYSGLAGELGETVPAIRGMTSEQLANGEAVKYMIAEYGSFVGNVGSTKIALDNMKQTVGDASEAFGSAMAPVVLVVTGAITGLASVVANAGGIMKDVMAVGAVIVMSAFTALAVRTGILTAAKWGLFGAEMAVNAAKAVGNPLLWAEIAAASGLVVGIGLLVAGKWKEAKATEESTNAIDANITVIKTARDALIKYSGDVEKYSDAQLKAAKADLLASLSKAKVTQEIADLTSKLARVNAELAARQKETNDASAAERYKKMMELIRDTIADNVSEEDKLKQKLAELNGFRASTKNEEVERLQAIAIVRTAIYDLNMEQLRKEDEERKAKAEAQKKLQEQVASDYASNMSVVTSFLDERIQRERELEAQIVTLASFTGMTQDDELLRLEALKNAQEELNELHEGTETQTFWSSAGEALDAYAKKMQETKLGIMELGKQLVSSGQYIFEQSKALSTQFYTTEFSKLSLAYQKDKKALDDALAAGLVTQEQYDAQLAQLDAKTAKEKNALAKKQFDDEKTFKIADVWMSAANSVAGWWAAAPLLGHIAGPIFAATMTTATWAMANAQTSLIEEQEFVPSYATGGTHRGGPAQINEKGAEIVNLPDGTVIVPRDLSEQVAKSAGRSETNIYLSFDGARIDESVDLDELTDKVSKKIAERVAR